LQVDSTAMTTRPHFFLLSVRLGRGFKSLSVTNNKSYLASIISLTSEPFQRTDISMQRLGLAF